MNKLIKYKMKLIYLFIICTAIIHLPNETIASESLPKHQIDIWLNGCQEHASHNGSLAEQRNCMWIACEKWEDEVSLLYGFLESKVLPKHKEKVRQNKLGWNKLMKAEVGLNEAVYSTGGTIDDSHRGMACYSFAKSRGMHLFKLVNDFKIYYLYAHDLRE